MKRERALFGFVMSEVESKDEQQDDDMKWFGSAKSLVGSRVKKLNWHVRKARRAWQRPIQSAAVPFKSQAPKAGLGRVG